MASVKVWIARVYRRKGRYVVTRIFLSKLRAKKYLHGQAGTFELFSRTVRR